jgi:UDP-2-acetamido-2-deoxy-ribo-hexuluronate aminotransferase
VICDDLRLSCFSSIYIANYRWKEMQLMQHLQIKQIPCAIYYPIPLHSQKAYLDPRYKEEDFPVTNQLVKKVANAHRVCQMNLSPIAF